MFVNAIDRNNHLLDDWKSVSFGENYHSFMKADIKKNILNIMN
ncbi:MAG: hypothetical protein AB3N34_00545 [Lettuce witches'-broom phytoplasma]